MIEPIRCIAVPIEHRTREAVSFPGCGSGCGGQPCGTALLDGSVGALRDPILGDCWMRVVDHDGRA
jgi:hypothetical protein